MIRIQLIYVFSENILRYDFCSETQTIVGNHDDSVTCIDHSKETGKLLFICHFYALETLILLLDISSRIKKKQSFRQ